jgi:hypothetical protein
MYLLFCVSITIAIDWKPRKLMDDRVRCTSDTRRTALRTAASQSEFGLLLEARQKSHASLHMKVLSEVHTFAFVNATISPVRIPDPDFLKVASHIGNHGPKTRVQRGQAPLQKEQEAEDFYRQRWIE